MTRSEALNRLRACEPQLRALGIRQLTLFGSTARGDEGPNSDVDLVARMDYEQVRTLGPFGFFGIEDRIADMLGAKVDFITEPTIRPWLKEEIERDRVIVF